MSQQPPSNPNQPPFQSQSGQSSPFWGNNPPPGYSPVPQQGQFPQGNYPPQQGQFPQGNYSPQQGYPQQFPQGYPQQQYQQPPMMQPPTPPKKKSGKGLLIAGIIVAILVFGCIGAGVLATHSSTATTSTTTSSVGNTIDSATQAPIATIAPTQAPIAKKWTTTHTFTGNGIKKTDSFTVPDTWQLVWKCDPTSFDGNSFNLIVGVDPTDGSLGDPAAINTLCSASNTHDMTTEHSGGNVYLDINSEGSWTIEVQEMK